MTLTLEHLGARPLTVNEARRLHPLVWARRNRDYRAWAWATSRANNWPHIAACTIVVQPLHRDGRSPQDAAA